MSKVIVVSDTSVIINLILINQLPLLINLFSEVVIPPASFGEIMQLNKFHINLDEFVKAKSEGRISIGSIFDDSDELAELRSFLDKGESEAIILAQELDADWLLIDERLGRKAATDRGLKIIGLLGVLRRAKQENLVSLLKPLLDDLRNKAGFWFSDNLYQEVLQSVNE
jgi:predicted nucleic acid-binding protein